MYTIPGEIPIVIEKFDLFQILGQMIPKELCEIIENHRINIIIQHLGKFRSLLPFKSAISIRYDGHCPLLRTPAAIINQFRCKSPSPPRISYVIAYLPPKEQESTIEYLAGILKQQVVQKNKNYLK
jgi:hypothetical protein